MKIALVASLAIVIAVPSALVWASKTQNFIFSRDLHVENFAVNGDLYCTNVTDAGATVADICVRIEHPVPNSNRIPILASIWHREDTELDSLTFRFSTEPYVTSVYMEATSYVWPETTFCRDGRGVILAVKDLGGYGTGTVTLNFILIPDQHSQNLGIMIDFSMHKNTFMQLTSFKVHAHLYASIPG